MIVSEFRDWEGLTFCQIHIAAENIFINIIQETNMYVLLTASLAYCWAFMFCDAVTWLNCNLPRL